jgi:hypothetical protein
MLQFAGVGRVCNVLGVFPYEALQVHWLLAVPREFPLLNVKTLESCPRNLRSTILLVYLNVVVRLLFWLNRTQTPTEETLRLHSILF